ncbi:MAG: leucyl aminopeptidase family protein, partial [Sphingomicrobium sp.]
MSDMTNLLKPDRGEPARTIHVIDAKTYDDWAKGQPQARRDMLGAVKFDGKTVFQFAILQGKAGEDFEVVTCVGDAGTLGPWCLANLGAALPAGNYRLSGAEPGLSTLGWMLAQHRFGRYKTTPPEDGAPRVLLTSNAAEVARLTRLAEATAWVRDLVDTPAADLGPHEIEDLVQALARKHHASVDVTSGSKLDSSYPMIAAVGAGAARGREPRLIELTWGKESDPRIAIVGKGVCFDSGGLNIKPGSGMRLMKKDMGGAAHAMALARLIMETRLPVRLHLLIPAVENSISGTAFRPGDVLKSRKGITVEVDNTDAEGRLVLGDALDKAINDDPQLVIDFATLTGAARVALGPDLPALFSNDDELADAILSSGRAVSDPVWRMPLWDGYDEMLKSDLADMANSADSPMAGAVTAALFLRRFVPASTSWAHLDTFAWHPSAKPGRPKGGEALGLRAIFDLL